VVQGRPMELRVEDHPAPLQELKRLITLHTAYRHSDAADELAATGNHIAAQQEYAVARELAPDREELRFWQAISSALEGSSETIAHSRGILKELGPVPGGRWWRLAIRLPATGLFPMESERWNQLLAPNPQVVYHILAEPASDSDSGHDELRPPSLETEGFVHCSFAHQLPDVLARHYPGIVDPPVMAVHTAELSGILVVEDSYGLGESYPHLYGPIPARSVKETAPLSAILPGILG